MKKLYLPITLLILSFGVSQIKPLTADEHREKGIDERKERIDALVEESGKLMEARKALDERLEKIDQSIKEAFKTGDKKLLADAKTDRKAVRKSLKIINDRNDDIHAILTEIEIEAYEANPGS